MKNDTNWFAEKMKSLGISEQQFLEACMNQNVELQDNFILKPEEWFIKKYGKNAEIYNHSIFRIMGEFATYHKGAKNIDWPTIKIGVEMKFGDAQIVKDILKFIQNIIEL